jgi:uncharacterized peroxidase-related enzyme
MAYIGTIKQEDATGELREIYENLIKSRGKLAEIHKIQSLNPKSIINHMDLYMTIMYGQSPLKRSQREMIAVIVSAINQCTYCQTHHGEALNHFWKDPDRVKRLIRDYTEAGLSDTDILLCRYAEALTREPAGSNIKDIITSIKDAGFDDRTILDSALVTAYFNFVNRLVLGLGVDLESDGGTGYRYEN